MIKIETSKTGRNRFVLCLGKTKRYHISRRELFQLAGSAVQALSKSVQGESHG